MSADSAAEAGPAGLASVLVAKGILTGEWLPDFEAVPRHLFVPDVIWPGQAGGNRQGDRVVRTEDPQEWWAAVYRDAPLTTQWDDGAYTGPGRGRTPSSSSSMPAMVFSMLAALGAERGDRVLEIGTGTGWNAALLSHRLGAENVVTVEVDPAAAEDARRRLAAAGYRPLMLVGDGALGAPAAAPYDRVIATCSVGAVPRAWIGQTVPGGVIVAPWGPVYGGEAVVRLTVGGDGTATGPFVRSSAFMRLRAQRRSLPPAEAYLRAGREWPAGGARSTTSLSPDEVGDWVHMFAIGVQLPSLFCRVEGAGGGAYRLWLFDLGITSWAAADYAPGRTSYEVVQSGPRHLWDELESAWRWWADQRRPGFDRFGLTVASDGTETVWLDTPANPVPGGERRPSGGGSA